MFSAFIELGVFKNTKFSQFTIVFSKAFARSKSLNEVDYLQKPY